MRRLDPVGAVLFVQVLVVVGLACYSGPVWAVGLMLAFYLALFLIFRS